jgi:hypothetical protein
MIITQWLALLIALYNEYYAINIMLRLIHTWTIYHYCMIVAMRRLLGSLLILISIWLMLRSSIKGEISMLMGKLWDCWRSNRILLWLCFRSRVCQYRVTIRLRVFIWKNKIKILMMVIEVYISNGETEYSIYSLLNQK